MTSKELLELAAKAAEYGEPVDACEFGLCFEFGEGFWNPRTDDGDALRLAYQLEMVIDFMEGRVIAGQPGHEIIVDFGDDYRLAIFLAAAEIGKRMK
jgi:hypothetical protein